MIPLKHISLLAFLSLLFTGIIFTVNTVLFSEREDEEIHLEPTLPDDFSQIITPPFVAEASENDPDIPELTAPGLSQSPELQQYLDDAREKKAQEKLVFSYVPELFQEESISYEVQSRDLLTSASFNEKIDFLNIELYQTLIDVRGKMKNKTIKMFGVSELSDQEYISVFLHEFAHYLDIYFFSRDAFGDTSKKFYDISWKSTTILQPGQKQSGFVSGYAMTNKYEDFGESLTYYILHNQDFLQKSENSEVLKRKYEFFGTYLFFNGEFATTDFSQGNVIRSYYWDITKLPVNVNNFLQYIKNNI